MTKQSKNYIQLNGRTYDTRTGAVVSNVPKKPQASTINRAPNKSMDGISASSKIQPKPIQPKLRPSSIVSPSTVSNLAPTKVSKKPTSRVADNQNHRQQQRSTTLMRKYVKKPTPSKKVAGITASRSSAQNTARISRAQSSAKSPFINKYGTISKMPVHKRTEPIKVATSPHILNTKNKTKINNTNLSSATNSSKESPSVNKTNLERSNKLSKSEQIFANALKSSPSVAISTKKKVKKPKSKALKWSSGMVAILLLAGFITYLNLPALNIKLASGKAGFNASIPNYQPSGYSLNGPVSHSPGKITVSFKSNTDDRKYSLKQEVSNWNSQSLQENALASKGKNYTTTQSEGKIIYFYDNGSSATWVNGGVWYQIESTSLSSDQLLRIASSL